LDLELKPFEVIMLEQIIKELEADRSETREIPASLGRIWMATIEPDVRGATYGFLHSAQVSRINPPLAFDEVFDFTLQYYEWCITTDPAPGAWANTRYSAGWDMVSWFCKLWDESREKKYFEKIKSRLAALYKAGDPDLKKAIEHATIEHLFENKQIRKFFADWERDADLKTAYDEGMLWVTHGGSSPLTQRPPKPHYTSAHK
jgi:hypothetical protein